MTAIAFFVTPHGFGHAARACAVMAALRAQNPALHFHLFTTTPTWFFAESFADPDAFTYHEVRVDVGLVQETSLQADLAATVAQLSEFLPFAPALVSDLAGQVQRAGCRLVLCDIAPLGIAVASAAGIPSILIENFTWDWIYEGYVAQMPLLLPYGAYLAKWFAMADYHIQTEPICQPAAADLRTPPISRQPRRSAWSVREELGLPAHTALVLLSMGGVPWDYGFLPQLQRFDRAWFIIPGGVETVHRDGNLLLWPYRSGWYHPDIVQTCDLVIAKLGYSTVAEAYQAGVPLGYVTRPGFRESPVLQAWVESHMPALGIAGESFGGGDWIAKLPELLALPAHHPSGARGADEAAAFVHRLLA